MHIEDNEVPNVNNNSKLEAKLDGDKNQNQRQKMQCLIKL